VIVHRERATERPRALGTARHTREKSPSNASPSTERAGDASAIVSNAQHENTGDDREDAEDDATTRDVARGGRARGDERRALVVDGSHDERRRRATADDAGIVVVGWRVFTLCMCKE
jgi:hypothetical protein